MLNIQVQLQNKVILLANTIITNLFVPIQIINKSSMYKTTTSTKLSAVCIKVPVEKQPQGNNVILNLIRATDATLIFVMENDWC